MTTQQKIKNLGTTESGSIELSKLKDILTECIDKPYIDSKISQINTSLWSYVKRSDLANLLPPPQPPIIAIPKDDYETEGQLYRVTTTDGIFYNITETPIMWTDICSMAPVVTLINKNFQFMWKNSPRSGILDQMLTVSDIICDDFYSITLTFARGGTLFNVVINNVDGYAYFKWI